MVRFFLQKNSFREKHPKSIFRKLICIKLQNILEKTPTFNMKYGCLLNFVLGCSFLTKAFFISHPEHVRPQGNTHSNS